METVLVYMTSWCPDCRRSRRVLDRLAVPYREIDIDENPESVPAMRAINGGARKVPTIVLPDRVLVEPADHELESALLAVV